MPRESFSRPSTKREQEKEITMDVQEYLRKKTEKIKDQRESISFNDKIAEYPISREEFEEQINDFIVINYDSFKSIVFEREDGVEEKKKNLNKLKVTNKDLRDFGFGDTSVIVKVFSEQR